MERIEQLCQQSCRHIYLTRLGTHTRTQTCRVCGAWHTDGGEACPEVGVQGDTGGEGEEQLVSNNMEMRVYRGRASTYTYAGSRNSISMQAGNRNMSITTYTQRQPFPSRAQHSLTPSTRNICYS